MEDNAMRGGGTTEKVTQPPVIEDPRGSLCPPQTTTVWDRLNPALGTLVRWQEGFNQSRPTREVAIF